MAGTTIDDRSANRNYQKPVASNGTKFDVGRMRLAIDSIDLDIATLIAQAIGFAPKASPIFTGLPEAPTPPGGDDSNRVATTAFVQDALSGVDTGDLAPIDSPTFIGAPKAPTAASGDSSTRLATTAFVTTAISLLVGAAPGALDTLNELAVALGNDPNFATTMTTALAGKAPLAAANPVSTVIAVPTTSAPTGYLKCNGAAYSRTTYAALFAILGTTYGVGDGSTTFNVPDFRGEFIRGLDDGRGVDTGRLLGAAQSSQNLSHTHTVTDPGHNHSHSDPTHAHSGSTDAQGNHTHGPASGSEFLTYGGTGTATPTGNNSGSRSGTTAAAGNHAHNLAINGAATGLANVAATTGISIAANGGTEARPRNQALLFCIKF